MALVVETGAMVNGANTYVDQATADSYHSDRGNAAWEAATDGQKVAALIAATTYLDGKYRERWKGFRVQPFLQPLEWPRIAVELNGFTSIEGGQTIASRFAYYFPTNQVPDRVIQAVCSLALRALSAALAPDLDAAVSSEKVDVIEVEYGKGLKGSVAYPEIDQLLSDYLKPLYNCEAVRG